MTFRSIGENNILATLTADEMSGYRISFDSMSLSDDATRIMLDDMLSVMEHMGLRHFGDRVTVECRSTSDGGCRMLFTVRSAAHYRFESCDDVLFAARSGALPCQPCSILPDGDGWLLIPHSELTGDARLLLMEFCTTSAENML